MRLCPWADVVYGCDAPWWQFKKGLLDFHGTKLAHDTGVCTIYKDVHKIEVRDDDRMLFDDPGVVGSGGNSGFQALNIVAQFGATRVLLIAFDMHGANGVHWYGPNFWPNKNNPGDHNFMRWREAFKKQAGVLRSMGVEVTNGSLDSALACFEKKPIAATLKDWGM